jgi:diacylglycerol kinase family enzyme
LLARRHTLALVPHGSGNDSARSLGLFPMSWELALGHALHAPAVPIDTGEMSSARRRVPFVSSLSAGFDAAVCARAVAGPRWLTGMPRYLWNTFGELAALRTWDLRVTVDGTLRHAGVALFASTCNTPTFGSGMPAVPTATIDDARLDLLLAGDFGRLGTLLMLPRLLAGTHLRDARVATWGYETLHIGASTAIPLAADGEPLGAVAEFEVRVRPSSLQVVVGPGRTALRPAASRWQGRAGSAVSAQPR